MSPQATLLPLDGAHWFGVRDGDPRVIDLYRRHYTYQEKAAWKRHSGIGGPGERLILLTIPCDALFVWRNRPEGMSWSTRDDGQRGIMCGVFRNESSIRSSDLIQEACAIAWGRWHARRLFTYVNPDKVKSRHPGYCFICAGFKKCGKTANGLIILDRWPDQTTD